MLSLVLPWELVVGDCVFGDCVFGDCEFRGCVVGAARADSETTTIRVVAVGITVAAMAMRRNEFLAVALGLAVISLARAYGV